MIRLKFFIQFIFILSFLIPFSCYIPGEPELRCIRNCNPAEYLILDEESCRCVPDPDALLELFCDGDINDCVCKEEDGGNWCTVLTGDSVKTWELVSAYNPETEDSLNIYELSFLYWGMGVRFLRIFRLDHILISITEETGPRPTQISFGSRYLIWEFDNVDDLGKIIYKEPVNHPIYNKTLVDLPEEYYEEKRLIKLTTDTLILLEEPDTAAYVYIPVDHLDY
jgi:hypothetical protein